jgi:DNA repair protein RadC
MLADAARRHLELHRARLRERFLQAGDDALGDHEVLELLLFGVLPRIDTKPVARALLERFGGLAGVVCAPTTQPTQGSGVGPAVAIHLKAVHGLLVRAAREPLRERTVLSSWSAVLSYLRLSLAERTEEEVRVLFLGKSHRLIADECLGTGTVDQAPVYPREIARRALELSASAVILTHNHPGGDPSPSAADVAMTRAIVAALTPLGVTLHDHIVVGRDGTASFKALGLI